MEIGSFLKLIAISWNLPAQACQDLVNSLSRARCLAVEDLLERRSRPSGRHCRIYGVPSGKLGPRGGRPCRTGNGLELGWWYPIWNFRAGTKYIIYKLSLDKVPEDP